MKSLLEVVSDGLLNEHCPSSTEDSAVVIRQAIEKLEKIMEIHREMWGEQREAQRNARADDRTDEDDDGEEDFDTKDLFSDDWLARDIKKLQEHEAKKENAHESSTSFTIEEIAKHEDGSATYTLNANDEDMKKLFEAFFIQALINGIKYTAADNEKEIAKIKALEVAREFEVLLREWEASDDFDYSPVCADKRKKLKELLDGAGA
jgi:hypothetical protein